MTMKITLSSKKNNSSKGSCHVRFFSEEQISKWKKMKTSGGHPFPEQYLQKDIFQGKEGQAVSFVHDGYTSLFVGLGKGEKLSAEKWRNLGALVSARGKASKEKEIHIEYPKLANLQKDAFVQAFCEGVLLRNYIFSKKSEKKKDLEPKVTFSGGKASWKSIVSKVEKLTEAVNFSRDLVNENANKVTPVYLANEAKKLAKKNSRIKVKILDEKRLKALGMGLFCAVGQGAENSPRMVLIEYKGNPKSKDLTALVGKGITFDSGGLNLKPTGHMEDMKMDMAGAGAVLGAMKALSLLNPKVNVIGALACAENAIGNASYRPGDIFTSYSGKTVEIGNTDAEGRLVLADTLSYVEKQYKPSRMIDLATLTGAALVALGHEYAPVLSKDKALKDKLFKASEVTDEKIWEFPLTEPYMKLMDSDVADVKNTGKTRFGGTIQGAVFLSKFIEKTPWAHLDIAGTAWSMEKKGITPKYGTGFGVRLLIECLSSF